MKRLLSAAMCLGLGMGVAFANPADSKAPSGGLDAGLMDYAPAQGVSGGLKSVGSDSMLNLMTQWAESFKRMYPNVKIEIEGKGSGTAPPALTESQAQFGPMSREMKADEVDKFEKAHGYKPTSVKTAVDSLAVYVHKDNPIESLSFDDLKKVFSVTGPANVTWGDLGLKGEWADKPISLYGRNPASGTYSYFKEHALGKTDYKPTVKEQAGSSGVVQGVGSDKFAIGYSGIGYKTADVKTVPLTAKAGGKPVAPSRESALSGEYPLARFLYVYVNAKPGSEIEPLRAEFIKLMLSKQGQEVVVKEGYDPLPASIANGELAKLGLGKK